MSELARFQTALQRRCAAFCEIRAEQAEAMYQHFELMLRWNRKMNLTRVTELEEAVTRHYAESAFLASHVPAGVKTIADIGSGPGFPGFPIAVLRPETQVLLVDSDGRKAAFLREASDFSGNIRVKCVRGEQLEDAYDAIVTRAVVPFEVQRIAERIGGWAGFLTGREHAEELLKTVSGVWSALPWDKESGVVSFVVPRET